MLASLLTRKSHAFDFVTLRLEFLTQSFALCGFTSAVEAFNDYQNSAPIQRHGRYNDVAFLFLSQRVGVIVELAAYRNASAVGAELHS